MNNTNPFQMRHFLTLIACLFTTSLFAQWTEQVLPDHHAPLFRPIVGFDGSMWISTLGTVTDPDPAQLLPSEFIRTDAPGGTYESGILVQNGDDYYHDLEVIDKDNAFLIAFSNTDYEPAFLFRRTTNGGQTWEDVPGIPYTFPDMIHFYNEMQGVYLGDPDELGLVIMITNDGGNTFTRVDPSMVPVLGPNEYPLFGTNCEAENNIFNVCYDFDSGMSRVLIGGNNGNDWTLGGSFPDPSYFGARVRFVDDKNGMTISGVAGVDYYDPLYTTDGGMTWQTSGPLPGEVGYGFDNIPGTNSIMAFFVESGTTNAFSALTNDLGRSWNTFNNVGTAEFDVLFTEAYGTPPHFRSNLEVENNHIAWGKISRNDLLLYKGETPIVPEMPDLELTLTADNPGLPLWGHVKYTLTMTNRGITTATGIRADWLPPYKQNEWEVKPYAFVGAYTDNGYYDSWNGIWTMNELMPGQSATCNFHLFVLQDAANVVQTAQIKMCNEQDIDSQPANMVYMPTQDDEASFNAMPAWYGSALLAYPQSEPTATSNFNVFPNPSNGMFTLEYLLDNPGPLKIAIVNTLNQQVWTKEINDTTGGIEPIDIRDMPTGLYSISFETSSGEVVVQKLVVVQ
jgi:Domain of unknown function DUF11/Secretion system C-terminal sorting domain